jgi:hypothetical protein
MQFVILDFPPSNISPPVRCVFWHEIRTRRVLLEIRFKWVRVEGQLSASIRQKVWNLCGQSLSTLLPSWRKTTSLASDHPIAQYRLLLNGRPTQPDSGGYRDSECPLSGVKRTL